MDYGRPLEVRDLDLKHEFTADGHWVYCKNLLDKAKAFREFSYAALELRICIERLCFEYLILFTHSKRVLTKNERKLYRPKEILDKVLKEEPLLEKKVDFVNAVFTSLKMNQRVIKPDFVKLVETHGKLGKVLHLQTEGMTDIEKKLFIEFLFKEHIDIKKYFDMHRGNIDQLKPHAQSIWDKFARGEITKREMESMVNLGTIPPHMYNPE